MSIYWLLFANLSVVASLVYMASFKLSGDNINAFMFTFILGCAHVASLLIVLLVARYGFKANLVGTVRPRGAEFAALAGLSVAFIDIGLFLAFRYGAAVLTNTYCSVAGIILFSVLSIVLFKDTLTVTKAVGILLGLVSLMLVAV